MSSSAAGHGLELADQLGQGLVGSVRPFGQLAGRLETVRHARPTTQRLSLAGRRSCCATGSLYRWPEAPLAAPIASLRCPRRPSFGGVGGLATAAHTSGSLPIEIGFLGDWLWALGGRTALLGRLAARKASSSARRNLSIPASVVDFLVPGGRSFPCWFPATRTSIAARSAATSDYGETGSVTLNT